MNGFRQLRVVPDVCFVEIITGDMAAPGAPLAEVLLLEHLAGRAVRAHVLEVRSGRAFATIAASDVQRLKSVVRHLNLALKIRPGCDLIELTAGGSRRALHDVLGALRRTRVALVHAAASGAHVTLVVDGASRYLPQVKSA